MQHDREAREAVDPRWNAAAHELHAQVTGKVVAVGLQQVVTVASVRLPHVLHQRLHLGRRKVGLAHRDALAERDCGGWEGREAVRRAVRVGA
jgi:hypothetical protein